MLLGLLFVVQFCWLVLFWWLGFGFETLAYSFAILVRLLASAGWVLA
jgi:hypothetical protein